MLEIVFLIFLILTFILFWWFIGHPPGPLAKLFLFIREKYVIGCALHIFSVETPNGKEAEFLDDKLLEKSKIVWFFRIILITVYFVIMVYLIFIGKRE